MGMLDSLGNLGGLGQITKMLDAGNWIKQGVNSVLPKNMHIVGDAAGALFDLKTGNFLGAAQLGMEALKDLPQATKGGAQQQQPPVVGHNAQPGLLQKLPHLEPSPPPAAAKPLDMNALLAALKQLTDILSGKKPEGAKTDTAKTDTAEPASTGSPSKAADTAAKTANAAASTPSTPTGTPTTMTTTTTTTTTTTPARVEPRAADGASTTTTTTPARVEARATDGGWHEPRTDAGERSEWRGTPTTPPPRTASTPSPSTTATTSSTPASTPAAAAPAAASAPAASAAAAPASSSAPASGETISSLAQLNSMSDSAVRDAVIHGRISPEVAKDQTAMMAIQQRMNAISEMNNLMTNMMRALHDMQMAVIQNIRI